MRAFPAALGLLAAVPLFAQDTSSDWTFKDKIEIRANYRDSREAKFPLKFQFPPEFLPVGQTVGFEQTVDPGRHAELSVAQLQLDLGFRKIFSMRAKLHGQDKYRRNPTSEDRKVDADELWILIGQKPEFLDRPDHTSFFLQMGKAPKMEKQPIRLLESYGLASTSFNRMEDVGFLVGGTVGRSFYWRFNATSGNPLFFRDPNALAGDNGIKAQLLEHPDPRLKSGFPILYNAETEGYFLKTDHVQWGEGIGYRWLRDDQQAGFDIIAFHYRRSMADREQLTGTFYGGDLDFLQGPTIPGKPQISLPIHGRTKEETGARLYSEWHGMTAIAQYTKQVVAGLHRAGGEVEVGYKFGTPFGPHVGGDTIVQSIQPAVRWSNLTNTFRAASPKTFVAPSLWWPWTKIDYGVRVGFARNIDITAERAKHNVGAPRKLDMTETLVTLRIRI